MKSLGTLLLVLMVMGVTHARVAQAHHSFAMFDETKDVSLVGQIKEVQWTNPHVWIQILVPDGKGQTVEWAIEATSPILLKRRGWTRNSLTAGEKVTLICHPLRDGTAGGSFVRVIRANGDVLGNTEAPPPSSTAL